jgi:hypothetical protein
VDNLPNRITCWYRTTSLKILNDLAPALWIKPPFRIIHFRPINLEVVCDP